VRNFSQIRLHYMHGWFAIDFTSCIPWDAVGDVARSTSAKSVLSVPALRAVRLMRSLSFSLSSFLSLTHSLLLRPFFVSSSSLALLLSFFSSPQTHKINSGSKSFENFSGESFGLSRAHLSHSYLFHVFTHSLTHIKNLSSIFSSSLSETHHARFNLILFTKLNQVRSSLTSRCTLAFLCLGDGRNFSKRQSVRVDLDQTRAVPVFQL
jgi:hypothetical protein